jgi:hypothetical protein
MAKHDTLTVTVKGYDLLVDFDYWPASKGRREKGGLQIEPDEPAGIEITDIRLVNPNDIFEMISEESFPTMEEVEAAVDYYGEEP